MSLSTNAIKLQKWLERYKITATSLYNRMGVNKLNGSFTNFLLEVKAYDLAGPGSFSATAQDDRIVLTWADITGETNYTLIRAEDVNFTLGLHTVTSTDTTRNVTDSGLTASKTYFYKVYGNATGHDAISSQLTTATTSSLLASASLTNSATYDTATTLTWAAVAGAAGYVLERATNAGFTSGLTSIYTGSLLTFSDTGLTPGTTYYYRVHGTATGKNIAVYANSTQATAAALAAPAAPVASSIGTTTLTLTWAAVSGATGYVIQRSATSGGTYATVTGGTVGNVLTLAVTGLTSGTDNYFKVYATAPNFTTVTKSAASALAHTN